MSTVLVAPLDWGLGHATRCIPVIRLLLQKRHQVFIAGNGESLRLLEHEFPYLKTFPLPGYDPQYPTGRWMIWKMFLQLPKFKRVIEQEHVATEGIIIENEVDLVISDNRYGCWSKTIPSVFITHQSNIMMPKRFGLIGSIVSSLVSRQMQKFSVCWIPDFPDDRFSGNLSKTDELLRKEYIGPLSRFSRSASTVKKYDVTAIFSGPEPQRSIFEKIVSSQLKVSGLKYFIVRGIPSSAKRMESQDVANYLVSHELQDIIERSEIVIARSGYSTVMDLAVLQAKAIFVPTPGQTEQEYLASELKRKKTAFSVAQKDFNLEFALKESLLYSGFHPHENPGQLLKEKLERVLVQYKL